MPDKSRTKVVHIVTLLELGGAQGNTIHTVRHLDPNRFDAHLWCGRGGYWDRDVAADLGREHRLRFLRFLVRPVAPLRDLLAILEIWWALRRERPDIMHTHSSKAGILGRLAARLARVPVIIHTFHGFGFNDRQSPLVRRFYEFLERRVARFSDRLVFVSESNWRIAEQLGIGDPKRYVLIRSGVPLLRLAGVKLEAHRDEARRSLGLPTSAPLVITLSAFKPQKNLSDFVEMAHLVSAECPEARFVIVGDGEQRSALESLIAARHMSERVRLPGWISDPARLLAASDAFVLTSLWEGLPRALVEAMALGVPSVCYKTDGVADLLQGDHEVRPRGDIIGLAGVVKRLLKEPDFARKTAVDQASRVTRDYDIAEMVHQQEMLYSDLMRQSRS